MIGSAKQHVHKLPAGWVSRSYPAVLERWTLLSADARLLAQIVYSECQQLCVITHAQFCSRLGYPPGDDGGTRCRRAVRLLESLGLLQCVDRSRGRNARAVHRICDADEAYRRHGLGLAGDSPQMQFDFDDFDELEAIDRGPGLVELRLFNPAPAPDSVVNANAQSGASAGLTEKNPAPAPDLSDEESGASAGFNSAGNVPAAEIETRISSTTDTLGTEADEAQGTTSQRIEAIRTGTAGPAHTPPSGQARMDSQPAAARRPVDPGASRVRARASQDSGKQEIINPQSSGNPDSGPQVSGASAAPSASETGASAGLQRRLEQRRVETGTSIAPDAITIGERFAEACERGRQQTSEQWERKIQQRFWRWLDESDRRHWPLARQLATAIVAGSIEAEAIELKIDYALKRGKQNPPGLFNTIVLKQFRGALKGRPK